MTFRISEHRMWVGNWCWDQIVLSSRAEAARLARYLRDSNRWSAEGGSSPMFEWFNARNSSVSETIAAS